VLTSYLPTLNDTITISGSGVSNYYYTGLGVGGNSGNITINNSTAMTGTISVGTISASTYTINGAGSDYNWKMSEEFVDVLPDLERIKKMCEQYPGFKIAFEKFKITYYLVKDDYDTPEDKRPKP
jgi:hypothetical protein